MLGIDFVNVFVHHNGADNFTAQLLRLYAKADRENKVKLSVVYPAVAALYEWWFHQPEQPNENAIMEMAKKIVSAGIGQ